MSSETIIVTGADAKHFSNSKELIASWWEHNRTIPLVFCDFGLRPEQREIISRWPIQVRPAPGRLAGTHPWFQKAHVGEFVGDCGWRHLIWIDADAMFTSTLPSVSRMMDGYDILLDAHKMSIGEVAGDAAIAELAMERTDAYFSSGFWITANQRVLREWSACAAALSRRVGIWENDAFVAAIYRTRARVRTVNGGVWHARTNTSADTCQMVDGVLTYAGSPVYVLHANNGYVVDDTGRRVFRRDVLRQVQERFRATFDRVDAGWTEEARDE